MGVFLEGAAGADLEGKEGAIRFGSDGARRLGSEGAGGFGLGGGPLGGALVGTDGGFPSVGGLAKLLLLGFSLGIPPANNPPS